MLLPDVSVPRTDASAVPEFLMNIYNCWSSSSADSERASCLPVSDRTAKNLDDVNVVRAIKGTGIAEGIAIRDVRSQVYIIKIL